MITDIYRIKTRNSIYEIQVQSADQHGNRFSRCRKEGIGTQTWKQVADYSGEYLEKLCIGPGFLVPGVVDTSNVEDYVHFVSSTEPKRKAKRGSETGIPEFFEDLTDHIVGVARGEVRAETCGINGCTVTRVPGLPPHNGTRGCKSGSIASGGTRAHCTCDYCY